VLYGVVAGRYAMTTLGNAFYSLVGMHTADMRYYRNPTSNGTPTLQFLAVIPGGVGSVAQPQPAGFRAATQFNPHDPYGGQKSLTVKRELAKNVGSRVPYPGMRAIDLLIDKDMNRAPTHAGPCGPSQKPYSIWRISYDGVNGARAFYKPLARNSTWQQVPANKQASGLGVTGRGRQEVKLPLVARRFAGFHPSQGQVQQMEQRLQRFADAVEVVSMGGSDALGEGTSQYHALRKWLDEHQAAELGEPRSVGGDKRVSRSTGHYIQTSLSAPFACKSQHIPLKVRHTVCCEAQPAHDAGFRLSKRVVSGKFRDAFRAPTAPGRT
jgi:hypothetical protein